MIAILIARPISHVIEDLTKDGAEFIDRDRMHGIWRGSEFKIFHAYRRGHAERLCGHVFTDFACFGRIDPEVLHYTKTRVRRL